MDLVMIEKLLLWCMVINYGILLIWWLLFSIAHDWLYRLHTRWFQLSRETFDAIHYKSMALYKIGVMLFNLAPYGALWIVQG